MVFNTCDAEGNGGLEGGWITGKRLSQYFRSKRTRRRDIDNNQNFK